jgi:hypothetical protein
MILDHEPVTAGVMEVIAYLQIAEDDGHYIYPDDKEEIKITLRGTTSQSVTLTMPKILFVSHPQRKRSNGIE